MQRRGVLVSVWVLCTAAATLIAWAAVSQVTQQVAPQAVLPLPTAAAVADLSPTGAPTDDVQVAREQQRDRRQARNDGQQPDSAGAGESAPVTEAYNLVGGVVTVRYSGSSAELVEASPRSGFVADVHDGGPARVDVRFRSDDHESRLVTRVRNGEPDPDREERSR